MVCILIYILYKSIYRPIFTICLLYNSLQYITMLKSITQFHINTETCKLGCIQIHGRAYKRTHYVV